VADILGFFAGRAIAENEGVDRERANQLGFIPAIMNGSSQSLLLTYFIARREAEVIARSEPAPTQSDQDTSTTRARKT
jgi:hypothetical protein